MRETILKFNGVDLSRVQDENASVTRAAATNFLLNQE